MYEPALKNTKLSDQIKSRKQNQQGSMHVGQINIDYVRVVVRHGMTYHNDLASLIHTTQFNVVRSNHNHAKRYFSHCNFVDIAQNMTNQWVKICRPNTLDFSKSDQNRTYVISGHISVKQR